MFRAIGITAVLNGWIVKCGCQTVVYQDRNQLVSDLDAYLRDPDATEARFLQTSVNHKHYTGTLTAQGELARAVEDVRDRAEYAQVANANTMPRDRG